MSSAPTGGVTPAARPAQVPTGFAALATTYFWPAFTCLFALFCLPAIAVIFLELNGFGLVPNQKLVHVLRLLNEQKISMLTDYGTYFLLPFAAYATLSSTSDENRRKGFTLFLVFLAFLVVCVVFYSLVWIQADELKQITYYKEEDQKSVTAGPVCTEIWKTYIEFVMLIVVTLLGIAVTQKG